MQNERGWLTAVLSILVIAYIASLPGRVPDIDDAWIGEHAYWLATSGFAKSELMRGITSQEEYLIVHHKLLTLHGALFIKLFGFSLYSLKSVSLLYFIIFLVTFSLYTLKSKKLFGIKEWLLSVIFIFSFPWIFKYSYLFRPELMLMTYAFLSFILLESSLEQGKQRLLHSSIAGLLGGLTVSTHLNGVVILGAGILLLLFRRSWLNAAVFAFSSLFTLSVYFYDFNAQYGFAFWYYQFTASPALDSVSGVPVYFHPLINLLGEHRRFFHNPKIIIFSALLLLSLFAGARHIWKNHRLMTLYALLLFILTALLAMHKSRQYVLIYFPFLVILITKIYTAVLENKIGSFLVGSHRWAKRAFNFLILVFLAGSLYYNSELVFDKFSPEENAQVMERHIDGKKEKLAIIAPMTFIFNEIEEYGSIAGEVCFTEMQKGDPEIRGTGFLEKADEYGIDFIYLTPYYREKLDLDSLAGTGSVNGWEILENNEERIIFGKQFLPAPQKNNYSDELL